MNMSNEHQLSRYIIYTCKKCNWQTAIISNWGDLKPKRCGGRKCGTSFIKDADMLDIKLPKEMAKKSPKKKKSAKKKTHKKKQD